MAIRSANIIVVVLWLAATEGLPAQDFVDTAWVRSTHQLGSYDLRCVAIGNSGNTMLVVDRGPLESDHARLVEIDLSNGSIADTLQTPHVGPVLTILMSDSADIVCTAESSQRFLIWSWNERRILFDIRDRPVPWKPQIAISPNGQRLFNASTGSMFDLTTGQRLWSTAKGLPRAQPRFTADGSFIITSLGYFVNYAAILDAQTGAIVQSFPTLHSTWISACALSDDNRYVVVVDGGDPTSRSGITVYDRAYGTVVMDTLHTSAHITDVHFMPDGRGFILDNWPLTPLMSSIAFQWGSWQPMARIPYSRPHVTRNWRWAYGCNETTLWLSNFNKAPGSLPPPVTDGATTIAIHPNPTFNDVYITGIEGGTGLMDVAVHDLHGSLVFSGPHLVTHSTMFLDLPSLAPGMYNVTAARGNTIVFITSFIRL